MKLGMTIAVLAVAGTLATGCTTAEQTAVGGAAAGALIGGAVTGNTSGAVAGALIGGTAGYLIGKTADGRCRYRDGAGRIYIAACP